jgi:hypothetical protein
VVYIVVYIDQGDGSSDDSDGEEQQSFVCLIATVDHPLRLSVTRGAAGPTLRPVSGRIRCRIFFAAIPSTMTSHKSVSDTSLFYLVVSIARDEEPQERIGF